MSDYPKKNYPQQERKYSILNDRKLVLTCYIKDKNAVSSLSLNVWNGTPCFVFNLFSNKNKADNEFFQARMPLLDFQAFLVTLKGLVDNPEPDVTYSFDTYKEVEREWVFDMKIVAGKDAANGIYIGAVKDGFAPRRYYMRPSRAVKIGVNKHDNNLIEQSKIYALAFYQLFKRLVPSVVAEQYTPPVPKAAAGGGGYNSGGGAPAPKSSSDTVEDSW